MHSEHRLRSRRKGAGEKVQCIHAEEPWRVRLRVFRTCTRGGELFGASIAEEEDRLQKMCGPFKTPTLY